MLSDPSLTFHRSFTLAPLPIFTCASLRAAQDPTRLIAQPSQAPNKSQLAEGRRSKAGWIRTKLANIQSMGGPPTCYSATSHRQARPGDTAEVSCLAVKRPFPKATPKPAWPSECQRTTRIGFHSAWTRDQENDQGYPSVARLDVLT